MTPEEIKEELLKNTEILLEGVVDLVFDRIALVAVEAIKGAIPGKLDDVILDAIKTKIIESLKQAALEQIEKISDKV